MMTQFEALTERNLLEKQVERTDYDYEYEVRETSNGDSEGWVIDYYSDGVYCWTLESPQDCEAHSMSF